MNYVRQKDKGLQEKTRINLLMAPVRALRHRLFGPSRPLVTVLPLSGVIGAAERYRSGLSYEALENSIDAAFAPENLAAVALVINSPGGSPVQSGLIFNHIRRLADKREVPVYAFAQDVAASGGYMLMLAGDKLYAHEASMIGSIGVVGGGFGFVEALAKLGLERRVYTQGENKVRLDPFQPEKPEDRAWLDGIQKDIHAYFKELVRNRRGDKLKGRRGDLFSGDVWLAAAALKHGLIDGIGDMPTILQADFGSKVKIKPVKRKKSFLSNLTGSAIGQQGPDAWLSAVEQRLIWQRWGL